MTKKAKGPQGVKCFKPSDRLVSFIEEKVVLLEKGEYSRSWDRRKVSMLDKLFQEFADLIYFVESTAKHPILREVFEDDLADLFDIRSDHKMKQLHPSFGVEMEGIRLQETNFTRLVFASVLLDFDNYENFRLKLLHNLQGIVYGMMRYVIPIKYHTFSAITKSAMKDLSMSVAWTAGLAPPHEYENDEPHRIIDFPSPYSPSEE